MMRVLMGFLSMIVAVVMVVFAVGADQRSEAVVWVLVVVALVLVVAGYLAVFWDGGRA